MEDKKNCISPSTDEELWASPIDLYSNQMGKEGGLVVSTPNVFPWKSLSSSLEDGDVSSKQQDSGYSSLTPSSSTSFSDGELFSKNCLYCNKMIRESCEPSSPRTICKCIKKCRPKIQSSHLEHLHPISENKSSQLFDLLDEPMDTSLYSDEQEVVSIPSESHGYLIDSSMDIGEEKSIDFMDSNVYLSKKASSDSGVLEKSETVKEAEVVVSFGAGSEKMNFSCDVTSSRDINQKTPTKKLDCVNFLSVAKKIVSMKRVIKTFSLNGIEKIDILYQLTSTTCCPHIVKEIFNYLSEKDLDSVANVSKSWNALLCSDDTTYKRWTMYKRSMKSRRENLSCLTKGDSPTLRSRNGPLGIVHLNEIQPQRPKSNSQSPPVSPQNALFRSFQKAAKTLKKGERLLQCPKCKFPSRDHGSPTLQCSRSGCRHHFCVWCRREIFAGVSHDCPPLYTPRTQRNSSYKIPLVGSKTCKRKLRRLTLDS